MEAANSGWRRLTIGAALALLAVLTATPPAPVRAQTPEPVPSAPGLTTDRSLAAALDELRARGLRVMYSSALVEPTMQALAPPSSADPITAAQEMLAPYGLGLKRVRPDLYAVVRVQRARRSVLAGRVVVAVERTAVASARVEIAPARLVGWTQGDGHFAVPGVEPGRYVVRISAEGYETRVITAFAPQSAGEKLVIELISATQPVEEVVISASRYIYESASGPSLFALDREQIRLQPSVGEDALQAVGRLPGFAFSGISARPNVRGGEASETLILVDGMPVRQAFHMPAYNSVFSVLDDDLVSRIDVFTGAFPARYGNRMSGVLELATRSASELPRHSLGLSVFNAQARTSGQRADGEADWLAAGRFGTLAPLIDRFAPDVGDPSYGDVFVKGSWRTPSGTELRAHFLGARDQLSFRDPDTGESAELDSSTRYAWVTATHALGERWIFDALLGRSSIESGRVGTVTGDLAVDGALADSRDSEIWDLRLRASFRPDERHSIELGLEGVWGDARYDYASEVEYDPIAQRLFGLPEALERAARVDASRSAFAFHASDRWRLDERWYLDAGFRVDHERDKFLSDRTRWSPRLSVRRDLSRATKLRVSWARVFQSDDVHELQVEDGLERFPPAQRADHLVAGLEHRAPFGLALRLEAFRKHLERPRTRFENVYDPLRFLPELSPDRIRVAPEDSELYGVELSGQWERGRWAATGAYTWSQSIDEVEGLEVRRAWDQKHTATLALAWRNGPWRISGTGLYRSGRPTTPILRPAAADPLLGPRNSERLAPYLSIDVRVTREFPMTYGRLVAFAQVTNLFNRRNLCCTEIGVETDADGADFLETERLFTFPALPAIGVTWEF
jgi:outer membrane receptor protein involved in Fe transport